MNYSDILTRLAKNRLGTRLVTSAINAKIARAVMPTVKVVDKTFQLHRRCAIASSCQFLFWAYFRLRLKTFSNFELSNF